MVLLISPFGFKNGLGRKQHVKCSLKIQENENKNFYCAPLTHLSEIHVRFSWMENTSKYVTNVLCVRMKLFVLFDMSRFSYWLHSHV